MSVTEDSLELHIMCSMYSSNWRNGAKQKSDKLFFHTSFQKKKKNPQKNKLLIVCSLVDGTLYVILASLLDIGN